MNNLERLKAGQMLLVGQIAESPNTMSSLRLIALEHDDIRAIHPGSRTSVVVCSMAYIKLATEQRDNEEGCGYLMHAPESEEADPAETIEFLEKSMAVFRAIWPNECLFAESVIKDLESAVICLCPAHLPGAFETFPALFPSGLGGNVSRTPSPVSNWSRDVRELIDDDVRMATPIIEGSFISMLDFAVPPIDDGL